MWVDSLERMSSSARIGCPRHSSTTMESSKTTFLELRTHTKPSRTNAPATKGPTGKAIRVSTISTPRTQAADLTPTSAAATVSLCLLRIQPLKMQGRWLAQPRQLSRATWNPGGARILLDTEYHKDQLERLVLRRFRDITTLQQQRHH